MEFIVTEKEKEKKEKEEEEEEEEEEEDVEELEFNTSFVQIQEKIPTQIQIQQQQQQQQQQQARPKPRNMTYDDILTSLNMKVVNGTLQMMQPPVWQQQQNQQNYKQVNMQNQMQQQQMFQMQNKHQIPVIEKQAPMSLLERKRLFVLNHLKRQAEIQRIRQIKSRKILFPQSNITISSAIRTNNVGFRFH